MPSVRLKLLAAVVLCLGLLVGLDRLIYSRLLFGLPNYSGWDSFRWYNFEYQLRLLQREADEAAPLAGMPRVLIVGSSIAKYSVQSRLLEIALRASGVPADVDLAVHAAMLPTDLYHYRERLLDARPDLVVYITNPADLDLERYLPPWEAGGGYSDRSMEAYLAIRHPMLYYYPGAFAVERAHELEPGRVARLLLRQWFYALRYKDSWRPILKFNGQVEDGFLRSYLNYQGATLPEGVWRDGWTGACFTLRREWLDAGGTVRLQILPVLQALPDFRMEFFEARGRDPARDCDREGQAYASLAFTKPDWQPVRIPPPPDGGDSVFVRLTHVAGADAPEDPAAVRSVGRDARVWDGRGVRLPGRLGRADPGQNEYYRRYPSLEGDRLASLSDAEYAADFTRRVHPLAWREGRYRALRQFNKLRISKYHTGAYDWTEIYQAREVRRFVEALRARGVKVLLVNNPENPLTRAAYEDNDWYRGYVSFYRKMAEADDGVTFADLRDRAPMQHFVDAHHLTYPGAEAMTGPYARWIARALVGEESP